MLNNAIKPFAGASMNPLAIVLAVVLMGISGPGHAASIKETIEQMNQRLDRIEQILQSQGLLDMLQQMESLQQELSQLRGEIEVQNHTLSQLTRRQRALYTDIDQRIQRLENSDSSNIIVLEDTPTTEVDPNNPPLQTLAPVMSDRETSTAQAADNPLTVELVENRTEKPVEAAPDTVIEAAPTTTEDNTTVASVAEENQVVAPIIESNPAEARADYQQAFKLLKQSLYDQAIKAFNEFLLTHPNSDYADNAQYWLGETYYATKQFEQALVEYDKLVANYPESQKRTHALLKIGYSHHEMGQTEKALALLTDLAEKFPGTTPARLAEDRIKQIKAAQQANATN